MTCCWFVYINQIGNFNSHAHEGRDVNICSHKTDTANFNSHAHEGRDVVWIDQTRDFVHISTHTPTRGVTAALTMIVN